MNNEISTLVHKFIENHGEDSLIEKLTLHESNEAVLTIISNGGVHPLNKLHKRGHIYVASEGNLDFSSKESAEREIIEILRGVAEILKSRSWNKVYLVPFGPSVLSMLIKTMVYKILYLDTIDILHGGDGIHYDIKIDPRAIAIGN